MVLVVFVVVFLVSVPVPGLVLDIVFVLALVLILAVPVVVAIVFLLVLVLVLGLALALVVVVVVVVLVLILGSQTCETMPLDKVAKNIAHRIRCPPSIFSGQLMQCLRSRASHHINAGSRQALRIQKGFSESNKQTG